MSKSLLSVAALLSALWAVGCETVTREFEDYTIPEGKKHSILDTQLEKLQRLSQEYPKRPDYPYQIAAVHFERAKFNESADALKKAIYLDPNQARYHYHLGRVYLKMRELEDAEVAFREAVRLTPKDRYSGPHAALGYVQALRRKVEPALEQFHTCIAIDPDVPTYYYFLGSLYDMNGDSAQAVKYFREYLDRGGVRYRKKTIFLLEKLGVAVEESALPKPVEKTKKQGLFEFDPDDKAAWPLDTRAGRD